MAALQYSLVDMSRLRDLVFHDKHYKVHMVMVGRDSEVLFELLAARDTPLADHQ